jgi:hypothetical protein
LTEVSPLLLSNSHAKFKHWELRGLLPLRVFQSSNPNKPVGLDDGQVVLDSSAPGKKERFSCKADCPLSLHWIGPTIHLLWGLGPVTPLPDNPLSSAIRPPVLVKKTSHRLVAAKRNPHPIMMPFFLSCLLVDSLSFAKWIYRFFPFSPHKSLQR